MVANLPILRIDLRNALNEYQHLSVVAVEFTANFLSQSQRERKYNMSTTPKVSKSRLAFEYLESHSNATAKEVIEALSQQGVKISDVNNAKQKMRANSTKRASTGSKKRGPKPGKRTKATAAIAASIAPVKTPKKRGRKPLKKVATVKTAKAASTSATVSNSSPYSVIEAGISFIEATGSIENARELLTLIEQIKKS